MEHFPLTAMLAVLLSAVSCNNTPDRNFAGATKVQYSDTIREKPENALRIVQYNVGVFSKETDDSSPLVAAMLKHMKADAVCLNELDSCNRRHENYQLKDFSVALGGWSYRFSRAMAWNGGAYGVGIALKTQITDSRTISLPRSDGSEPRACCVVETADYVLAATHLDFQSADAALLQAKLLSDELLGKYGKSKKAVVLCGDMNATPDSPVINELSKNWIILSARKATYPAKAPSKCIDYIMLLKNDSEAVLLGSATVSIISDGNIADLSDHLPLIVDLQL